MKTVLQDYFHRISFSENSFPPDLEILNQLILRHTHSIPFENLNPFLGIPVKIDIESLFQKIIYDQRGGYCYEQNLFFMEVLKQIGFEVEPLSARVHTDSGALNARTHMLLMVNLGGSKYLADVGFGGMTPTAPLKMDVSTAQETLHNSYKIEKEGNEYQLLFLKDSEWHPLYTFDFQTQYLVDFEMANWYTSTNPKSHFLHELMISRVDESARYNLRNNVLSCHFNKQDVEQKTLTTTEQVRSVLREKFGLKLVNLPGLDERLLKLVEN